MKKRKLLISAVVALMVLIANGAFAQITFWGDWETGLVTGPGNQNWKNSQVFAADRIRVINNPSLARQGNYYARVEVRHLDRPFPTLTTERAEVVHMQNPDGSVLLEDENSGTIQYAFSIKFDSGWLAPLWVVFIQLHSDDTPGAINPTWSFTAEGPNLNFKTRVGNTSTNSLVTHPVGDLVTNKWIDFILTVKYAKDNTGFFIVQRRDEGQSSYTEKVNLTNTPTLQYAPDGTMGSVFMKTGLYRPETDFTSVLYLDGFTRTVLTTPSSLPDVVVTSLSYNASTGIFTSVVKNQGTVATPAGVAVGVGYKVDGGNVTWGAVASPPLAAGASATVGTNGAAYIIPTCGTHTITAYVDDVNRFAESDENNNQFSQTITVGIPSAPTVGTITQPTSTVATGSVVLNGLPATGTWTLTTTPGGIITTGTGASKTIAGLAPGTYTYTVTNAAGCTSAASANVVINAQPTLPDVIVTSLSYNASTGIFTCVVKNQGTTATPAGITVGVGYSVDGEFRTWGAVASPPLAAGASATVGTNGGAYTIPNGTHTITAYVDDINRFAESDENNNQFSQTVNILDPSCKASTANFQGWPIPSQANTFTATFDAIPAGPEADFVIGLSNGAATEYNNLGPIITFTSENSANVIKARNGSNYVALTSIPYTPGIIYHLRLVINVADRTYNAYVTPQGGSEITIGLGYAFRSNQTPAGNLNYWNVITSGVLGDQVCSFNIGTAYRWSQNTSAASNSPRVAAAGLNDGNFATDVPLNNGVNESANMYEAAGVVWSAAQTVGSVYFTNGSWVSGKGSFTAGLALQFTTDGTTWTNATDWTVSPAYNYNASNAGTTFKFSGPQVTGKTGFRIVGQCNTGGTGSKEAYIREVEAYANSTKSATIIDGMTQVPEIGNAGFVKLYPNPANRTITLELSAVKENEKVQIYSILGELVKELNVSAKRQQIDIESLVPGIYIVRLTQSPDLSIKFSKQ